MVNIAIIEHNPKLSNSLKDIINDQAGFNCQIAESRIGAFFEKLNLSVPPDILVLDSIQKNGTIADHLSKLKALLPHTKLMIHSGKPDEELLSKALRTGVNAFLIKDGHMDKFLATLRRLEQGEDFIDPKLSGNIIRLFQKQCSSHALPDFSLGMIAHQLNERELQVVRGLMQGKQYKEIAAELFLSINTVRHYVKLVYRKMKVSSRVELMHVVQKRAN